MKKHRDIPEKYCLKSVTISMEPSGKYYASLLYEKTDCENQAEELDYEDAKILVYCIVELHVKIKENGGDLYGKTKKICH